MPLATSCYSCDRWCGQFESSDSLLSLEAPLPKFYLYEHGAFSFGSVERAFDKILHGLPPDMVLPLKYAQHLVDIPLIKSLRKSVHRTYVREEAEAIVIGALPFASECLAHLSQNKSLAWERHMRRMDHLALALEAEPCFLRTRPANNTLDNPCALDPGATTIPWLLIASGLMLSDMLGRRLQHVLAKGRHVVLATVDPSVAAIGSNIVTRARFLMGEAIALPYWAHTYATQSRTGGEHRDNVSGDANKEGVQGTRIDGDISGRHNARHNTDGSARSGVMFHGGLGRADYGVRQVRR